MRTIETSIDIEASPATVWKILTGFRAYPTWNPFIVSISGPLEVGETLTVNIRPPGRKVMTFKPRVLVVTPERELRWKGKALMPGLFDGEHHFRLEPIDGGTRLHHGERFSGLLVPLMAGPLQATEQGFRAMNQALKERAEA